ncbi:hypothetical protein KIN20_029378, partial [Parelaphostrongylus tenuis]
AFGKNVFFAIVKRFGGRSVAQIKQFESPSVEGKRSSNKGKKSALKPISDSNIDLITTPMPVTSPNNL